MNRPYDFLFIFIEIVVNLLYNTEKVRFLNGVYTGGRATLLIKGGGCYETIHTKNYIFGFSVFDSIYYKSKMTALAKVRSF